MKQRPLLFTPPMVREVLDGTKTQTRRLVKGMALEWLSTPVGFDKEFLALPENSLSPYGYAGDRLWVRETCRAEELPDGGDGVRYLADDHFLPIQPTEGAADQWIELYHYRGGSGGGMYGLTVPSIHMPRWASRITLEITGVRVERLQDISEADCIAEGCAGGHGAIPGYDYAATPIEHYHWLWNSINGRGSWEQNPWVWVIEFKREAA